MLAIPPPPEFAPPSPFRGAEGYWAPLTQRQSPTERSPGWYAPQFASRPWGGKRAFAAAVRKLEARCVGRVDGMRVRTFPGWAPSRIPRDLLAARGYKDGRHLVGRREFYDDREGVRWPENYVRHYVVEFDVVPTRRFFEYVCRRAAEPPKQNG